MKTLAQNSANDIYISSSGQLALNESVYAYADIIADTVRTLKGEIQLDENIGIDYMGTVFKSVSRTHIWKHYVSQAIEALQFVRSITSFDASYISRTRVMTYKLTVLTDKGVVEVSNG